MHKGLVFPIALVLAGGGAIWSARAGDDSSVEDRLAGLERRMGAIEERLSRFEAGDSVRTGGTEARDTLTWTTVRDVADLRSRLADAAAKGTPVVVATWAEWSKYDKMYRSLIEDDVELREKFSALVRLTIDVTKSARDDLREATGLKKGQPLLAFYDAAGRRVDAASISGWKKEGSKDALLGSLIVLLLR